MTGTAIEQSIQAALQRANLRPADIGHVSAHGEGSVAHDACEARAIQQVLGDVPVTALKSYFGDLGAGSGAVELAATVLALAERRIPPTLNYESPDPACPVNVIHGSPRAVDRPTAVALSQSNTGQAAALVIAAS